MYYIVAIPLLLLIFSPLLAAAVLGIIMLVITVVVLRRDYLEQRRDALLRASQLYQDAMEQDAAGEDTPYGLYGRHMPARGSFDDVD